MKFVRWFLGRIVLFFNWLTWPKQGQRDAAAQVEVEQSLARYSLYHFDGCPFCIKVRRAMQRMNLPIELRDASPAGEHRTALANEGGRIMVPCLRIEKEDGSSEWMYESKDIIAYLDERYGIHA
jgi:glutaredoxin